MWHYLEYEEDEAELQAEAAELDADPDWVADHPDESGLEFLNSFGPAWVQLTQTGHDLVHDISCASVFSKTDAEAFISGHPEECRDRFHLVWVGFRRMPKGARGHANVSSAEEAVG